MSSLASEALKFSTQVTNILQLISTFNNTTGAIKSLSDKVEILAIRSQGKLLKWDWQHMLNSRLETKEEQILDWLSSNDYSRTHHDISVRRFDGTGKWLLDCEKFQSWLNNANPVLLCTGSPGVGKSVLTYATAESRLLVLTKDRSLVIDHIRDHRLSYAQGLGYFYFEYANQHVQTPTKLVGSLLRQLSSQAAFFPQPLLHFYQRFREDEAHGSTTELLLILKDVCKRFEKSFIVIDALDECQKRYRGEFLHILTELNTGTVQIFMTSRPHSQDIKQHFKGIEHTEIVASEADIRSYCQKMIDSNDGTRELMDDKLRIEITDNISKNAQGMYTGPHFLVSWFYFGFCPLVLPSQKW